MSGSCSHCQNSPRRMSTCSCGGVSYCDSTCQKADWKHHKSSCPPYKIQEVQGKGKGMVATRNIKAGDLILEESPLLIVNKDSWEGIRQLIELSESLCEEEKQKVLSLYDPGVKSLQHEDIMSFLKQTEMLLSWDRIKFVRIAFYNCICIAEGGNVFGTNCSALCKNISRIGHSCAPNCFWKWKKGGNYVQEVRAMKDIQKGEEIVASYLSHIFMLRNDRKDHLGHWGIDCRCKICSLQGDDLKKNEDLRAKIKEQDENIPKYTVGNDLPKALFAATKKLNLMSEREDEFISDMLSSSLELYELSFILGNMPNVTGSYKKKLEETASVSKKKAFELAKKFGSAAMFQYENKMSSLSVVDMLNRNTGGGDLWSVVNEMDRSLYVVTGEVARGVLVRLVQAGMMEEATSIYRREELVTTGTYEKQVGGSGAPVPASTPQPQNGGGPGGPRGPAAPDYSAQWAEYYRSIGKHKEADAIEEMRAKSGSVLPGPQFQGYPGGGQPQPHGVQPHAAPQPHGGPPHSQPQPHSGYPQQQGFFPGRPGPHQGGGPPQDTEGDIFKLNLKSYYSQEELQIIIPEFFKELEKTHYSGHNDVFISMSEEDIPPSRLGLLKEVVSSKKEALNRVCRILAQMDPPMSISVADVPFIPKEQVLNHVSKGQKSEKADESNHRSSNKSHEEDYSNLCWSCSKTKAETKLYKCTGCKKARYCGRECIEHDWPVHKNWCLKRQKKKKTKKADDA